MDKLPLPGSKVFIIIPAYNEAEHIGRVVRGLFSLVRGLTRMENGITQMASDLTVIVVDDGSSDETAEVARQEGALVIQHALNRGQGAALQTGNEYALQQGADIVVHFDGDGQFDPQDIDEAVKALKVNEANVIMGSRFLGKETNAPWLKRKIILPLGKLLNNLFTGISLTDVHNGFRVLDRTALEKINITHDGMAHASEIIAQIKKYRLRYAEHPVTVRYHEFGQGLGGGVRIFYDLFMENFR